MNKATAEIEDIKNNIIPDLKRQLTKKFIQGFSWGVVAVIVLDIVLFYFRIIGFTF